MKLPGRFRVSPQIAGAIKAVSGVWTCSSCSGACAPTRAPFRWNRNGALDSPI